MASECAPTLHRAGEGTVRRLIDAVRARPGIWKAKSPGQPVDKRGVQKLWMEIQTKFPRSTVPALRTKWKNVKDQFRKEMKKFPPRPKGEENMYPKSQWLYFDHMQFLAEELLLKTPYEFPTDEPMEDIVKKSDGKDLASDDENCLSNVVIVVNKTEEASPQTSSRPSASARWRLSESSSKREFYQLEKKKIEIMERDLEEKTPSYFENSDDYYFFMSLMPQMANMSTTQKLRIRGKILKAIIDENEET